MNRREGVRAGTVARVEEAILKLGYRTDPLATRLARNRTHRFAFILPTGANSFMTLLEEQVRRTAERLAADRAFIDVIHTDVFDPNALAGALENLPDGYHGVALVALDHARVRAAIDDLVQRGVPVVTLVSDVPQSRRIHYVGIDNPAAGRTAGALMGRFLAGSGARSASSPDRWRSAITPSATSVFIRCSRPNSHTLPCCPRSRGATTATATRL